MNQRCGLNSRFLKRRCGNWIVLHVTLLEPSLGNIHDNTNTPTDVMSLNCHTCLEY